MSSQLALIKIYEINRDYEYVPTITLKVKNCNFVALYQQIVKEQNFFYF